MATGRQYRLVKALILLALSSGASLFAQPSQAKTIYSEQDNQASLQKNWDFFFTLGPALYINTDKDSAPSPVSLTGGAGFDFLKDKAISLQPKLSFFTGYYLWDGENARPAEIENRTAIVLSALLDLDAVHRWRTGKNIIEAGAGLSFLARAGMLANGVSQDDSGGTESSTAGDDVSSINRWFYSGMNFLYPNIAFSWMHTLESGWLAGLETKLYFPLGAIADGRALDTMIIFAGIKICSR